MRFQLGQTHTLLSRDVAERGLADPPGFVRTARRKRLGARLILYMSY